MSAILPRLVYLQDRLSLFRDTAPVWRVNPRTGSLETRAGLSWTGVREYQTSDGPVRVLRRPEQVNSPGHLRTLRRLPACDGHPAGDVDVSPSNSSDLIVGYVGDEIAIEDYNGYARPVGNVSVFRPEVIAKMVDSDTWAAYCKQFECYGIKHSGAEPCTGTSLGYNALWYAPYVEDEIVGESGGQFVGEWLGPYGAEQYDVEHIVDPECEIVQQLAENTGFDPARLGGNHFAIALQALGGRGAEQSELMRIVDSCEIPIPADRVRVFGRGALHSSAMRTRDAKWTVGADRDLAIAEGGSWDGDAAKRSVFAWAGWPDSPKPEQARRAFLIYDAEQPELIGSYKLPIARYNDGKLEVSAEGLRAAASRLPQTDAPQDVLDRARAVLDHYFARMEAARDASQPKREKPRVMKTLSIDIGQLGRDQIAVLQKLGITAPQAMSLTLDEIDAEKLSMKLSEMSAMLGELIEMAGKSSEMESAMADMMSAEEAAKAVEEAKAQLAAAEAALAEAKAAEAKMSDELDKAKKTCDVLTAELEPLRAEKFARFADEVVGKGFDETAVKACTDSAALRRLVVTDKLGERYAEGKASDEIVAAAFEGIWATIKTPEPEAAATPEPTPTTDSTPAVSTLSEVPAVSLERDSNPQTPEPAKVSTSEELALLLN